MKKWLWLAVMGLGMTTTAQAVSYEQLLVGQWQCQSDYRDDEGLSLKVKSTMDVSADGRMVSREAGMVDFLDLGMAYHTVYSSEWSVSGDRLTTVVQSVDQFQAQGELADFMDVPKLMLEDPEAIYAIKMINKEELVLEDLGVEFKMQCQR